jgi:hypothetical protein
MVLKITIDTNRINARKQLDEMNKLEQLRDQGRVEIVGTQRLLDEIRLHPVQPQASNKVRSMRNVSEPFVLGHSALGSAYLAAASRPEFDEIAEVLFPEKAPDCLSSNEANDVMHLLGHCHSDSDCFVTDNQKDFIKSGKRELLHERFGIIVMTDAEVIKLLTAD